MGALEPAEGQDGHLRSSFWRALKRLNVPTQLVVYANEGHGIRRPENRRDILRRSVAWLNRALKADGGSRE